MKTEEPIISHPEDVNAWVKKTVEDLLQQVEKGSIVIR